MVRVGIWGNGGSWGWGRWENWGNGRGGWGWEKGFDSRNTLPSLGWHPIIFYFLFPSDRLSTVLDYPFISLSLLVRGYIWQQSNIDSHCSRQTRCCYRFQNASLLLLLLLLLCCYCCCCCCCCYYCCYCGRHQKKGKRTTGWRTRM